MATAVEKVDNAPPPPVRQVPPHEAPSPQREASPPPAQISKEPVAEKEVGGTVNVKV
jgi:hypothetical protein